MTGIEEEEYTSCNQKINDIYNEAIQEERAPFIRHLTPITLIDDKELPSPRILGISDFKDKEPEKNKARNLIKRFYKPVNFNDIIGSELDVITKK